jgi:hypothetical protein
MLNIPRPITRNKQQVECNADQNDEVENATVESWRVPPEWSIGSVALGQVAWQLQSPEPWQALNTYSVLAVEHVLQREIVAVPAALLRWLYLRDAQRPVYLKQLLRVSSNAPCIQCRLQYD